jgi:xanthine dehydrogenase accessory factor
MGLTRSPLFQPDATQQQLLASLHLWLKQGQQAALVVITAIEGRTSRAVGTMMAVSASGDVAGSISGGCFDAAVITEARAALEDAQPRHLRLGAGSPWIDIKLPCGGGLDLLIVPNPDAALLDAALQAIAQRQPFALPLSMPVGGIFNCLIQPRLRLIVAGNGGEVAALVGLALGLDAEVVAVSPERRLLDTFPAAVQTVHLKTAHALDDISVDSATAFALFFHDHDWEPPLLAHALSTEAFFVGAMGSLATHEARTAVLLERGVDAAAIDRIASPLGLFAPARDPQALAVSALAQIMSLRP